MRYFTERFARESRLAGQHFKQNHAHGKEIRPRINSPAIELFGGRVPRSARNISGDGASTRGASVSSPLVNDTFFAIPKANSFFSPFPNTMLLGLRSRWTNPILLKAS